MTTDRVRLRLYLLIGVSAVHRRATEEMLIALRDTLSARPTLGDRVRVGIIEFADDAVVRLPLADLLDPALVVPPPGPEGDGNSITAGLSTLRTVVDGDATRLVEDGVIVERPVAWLITDRPPTDDPRARRRALTALTDHPGCPYIVPCGLTSVAESDLAMLVHPVGGAHGVTAYRAEPSAGIGALGESAAMTISDTGMQDPAAPVRTGIELPHPDRLPPGVRMLTAASVTWS